MSKNPTKAEADDDDIVVVDRSCISCDKCGVGSPQKCCARCGSFYFAGEQIGGCVNEHTNDVA